MNQKDKELVLKDLSARLPYGVKIVNIMSGHVLVLTSQLYATVAIENFRPYLRPMSSMTKEEKKKYYDLCDIAEVGYYEFGELVSGFNNYDTVESIDYLNSIHVDYRGLIEKGLAIKVTEENNPYKT